MMQLTDLLTQTNIPARKLLNDFTNSQRKAWPLAGANFASLEKVEVKIFDFGDFEIKVQFNPERMISSSAKTDKQSIAARKCFLCAENRPVEQDAIRFGDQFLILVNPFPIFRNHFTITATEHTEQRFLPNAKAMFDLAEAMAGFTVFYNGPECGASAPDHMHFQAGENEFMPLNLEFERLKNYSGKKLFSGKCTRVWVIEKYLRKMITVETSSVSEGMQVIELYYRLFSAMQPEKDEPMMNVLCTFNQGSWTVHLFPRRSHRPWQYFAPEKENFLISPGSVDFGGVFITPRRSDFDKITQNDLADMLQQVCISAPDIDELTKNIQLGIHLS